MKSGSNDKPNDKFSDFATKYGINHVILSSATNTKASNSPISNNNSSSNIPLFVGANNEIKADYKYRKLPLIGRRISPENYGSQIIDSPDQISQNNISIYSNELDDTEDEGDGCYHEEICRDNSSPCAVCAASKQRRKNTVIKKPPLLMKHLNVGRSKRYKSLIPMPVGNKQIEDYLDTPNDEFSQEINKDDGDFSLKTTVAKLARKNQSLLRKDTLVVIRKKEDDVLSDSKIATGVDREEWSSKADFLLSIIGFAVDLSNIWRFPYLCYKNGGGAFLIPYTIMLIFGGVPLLYMELALGQYNRAGAVGIWKMVPFLKGTGYAAILITFYVSFYYPVIIGYSFYYLFASFTTKLPWSSCDNSWNTPNCVEHRVQNMTAGSVSFVHHVVSNHAISDFPGNRKLLKTASEEYFERKLLNLQDGSGFHHLTPIKWDICLCTLLVYFITFLSLFKGVKTSGKVVWFTAIAPYVLLTILLVQALLLPGSLNGIVYYLTPQLHKLKSAQVWYEAAVQIFYSTGPGFGVHIAYASYNKFHNNIQTDVLITCAVNSLTSFFSGFVVFAFLGYMSLQRGLEIDRVAKDGPGLVFIVYPEALAILKGSIFFSIIFFITLMTLGLDSLLGGMEAIITGLLDDLEVTLNRIGISKKILIAIVIFASFSVSLLCTTKDGIYWITFLDTYAAGTALLFIVFFEAVGVTWIYGVDRFAYNIQEMIGFRPNIFWRLCWKYISPCLIMGMIISGFVLNEPLRYGDYVYPRWANFFGWCLVSSSILTVPAYALWKFYKTDADTVKEKFILWLQSKNDEEEIQTNDKIIQL